MINKELDGFIASTGFAILRKHDNKLVDWNYLFHILRTELILKQLQRRSSGGNYPAITLDELAKILIPIPKPVIQREIINLFDKSLQRYNSEILKTKDLLGSIDKYVLSGLGIELPELKDKTCFIVRASEVKGNRLDPKCYSKIKKNIINSINKSNYKTDFLENLISKSLSGEWGCSPEEELDCESILCKVIRNVNFDNDFNLNLDDIAERKIPVHKYNNAKLEIGDILIEKSGGSPIQPVGRVAIIEEEYEDFFFSNFLRLIKIKKNICLPEYLFGVLKTFYRLNLMEYLQNQTTGIKNLIFEEYLEIPIPIPALPIQQKIADEVKSRMDKAKQLQIEARQTIEQAKKEAEKMILGEK
jgi:restriction endonuclease S subunit